MKSIRKFYLYIVVAYLSTLLSSYTLFYQKFRKRTLVDVFSICTHLRKICKKKWRNALISFGGCRDDSLKQEQRSFGRNNVIADDETHYSLLPLAKLQWPFCVSSRFLCSFVQRGCMEVPPEVLLNTFLLTASRFR